MGVEYTILGDNSDVWDTPTDGEFRMYDGGTTLEEAANAIHAKATISMQEYCTEKTLPVHRRRTARRCVAFNHPVGVAATDEFLMEVSRDHRQADPGGAGAGARPSGRRDRRLRARISTARSSRSTAIRISVSVSRPSCSSSAPSRPMCSPPTATRPGPRRCRRCSTARRSARTATSIRARISGTCARCCSPSRSIS